MIGMIGLGGLELKFHIQNDQVRWGGIEYSIVGRFLIF